MAHLKSYPCGLRLVVESIPYVHSVAAGIMVGTGSAMETPENNGISHYIEHVLFKGTDKMSAFELAKAFESKGASVNAFTSKEVTCFYYKSIDSDVESCFTTMCDLFFHSVFDKKELDSERKVVLEEISMDEDSPEDICYDLLAKAVYGDQSIGMPVLGKRENVKRFDKAEILEYIEKRYRASDIVIAFAGNVTLESADDMIKKHFLPEIGDKKCNHINYFTKYEPTIKTFIKDFKQSNLMLAYPSLALSDPMRMTQAALSVILGGCMGSRLFQDIREKKGLAYSVYTSPSLYRECGTFNIVLNINAQNTARVLDSTLEELRILVEKGITPAELDMAKAQLKATLVFGQEAIQSIMNSLCKSMLSSGELFDVNESLKKIDAVTIDGINVLAKRVFSAKPALAYVGVESGVSFEQYLRR